MCYSAQIKADYLQFRREHGATLSIKEFFDLYWQPPRAEGPQDSNPEGDGRGLRGTARTMTSGKIKALIDEFNAQQAGELEQELFKQRKRLADAERTLQTKTTKAATESKRIATDKVQWCLDKLAALRRTELTDDDARIFPGWYAPVMVMDNGRRVIKPMRYQCRPAGKPAFYDAKFPGTYNARRDNLEGGFWKSLFGTLTRHHDRQRVLRARGARRRQRRARVQAEADAGHAGGLPVVAMVGGGWSRTCCRSQPSPTSRRPKWRPRGMIAASCRSSK